MVFVSLVVSLSLGEPKGLKELVDVISAALIFATPVLVEPAELALVVVAESQPNIAEELLAKVFEPQGEPHDRVVESFPRSIGQDWALASPLPATAGLLSTLATGGSTGGGRDDNDDTNVCPSTPRIGVIGPFATPVDDREEAPFQ